MVNDEVGREGSEYLHVEEGWRDMLPVGAKTVILLIGIKLPVLFIFNLNITYETLALF